MSQQLHPSTLVAQAELQGASWAFLKVLETDSPTRRHHPRRKVMQAVDKGFTMPAGWGGFMSALWEGDVRRASRYADKSNTQLLKEAGLY